MPHRLLRVKSRFNSRINPELQSNLDQGRTRSAVSIFLSSLTFRSLRSCNSSIVTLASTRQKGHKVAVRKNTRMQSWWKICLQGKMVPFSPFVTTSRHTGHSWPSGVSSVLLKSGGSFYAFIRTHWSRSLKIVSRRKNPCSFIVWGIVRGICASVDESTPQSLPHGFHFVNPASS